MDPLLNWVNRINLVCFCILISCFGCTQLNEINHQNNDLAKYEQITSPSGFLTGQAPNHGEIVTFDLFHAWDPTYIKIDSGNPDIGYGSWICADINLDHLAIMNDDLSDYDLLKDRLYLEADGNQLELVSMFAHDSSMYLDSLNAYIILGGLNPCWDGANLGIGIHEIKVVFTKSDGSEAVAQWAFEIIE